MENTIVEFIEGELRIKMETPLVGKFTLKDLGFSDPQLRFEGGHLRILIEMGYLGDLHLYKMPTAEFHYFEKLGEAVWQVEFNEEVILEKVDHSGHSTLLLLNRQKIEPLRHRHTNNVLIHADLPAVVTLKADECWFYLLEEPGQN